MAADLPPMSLEQVQAYHDRPAHVRSADEPGSSVAAKIEALKEAALGIGVKAGLRKQLAHIHQTVESHRRDLDTVYDFGSLMIRDRVVPAVITEARDLYNQDGAYALRLSGAYYKIEQQPRFSSVPPHWRDYLSFGSAEGTEDDALTGQLRPRTDAEREIWKDYIAKGWHQGVDQANVMLQYGLDRLNRDMLGMIRFHTFVLHNRITMPAIASQSWDYTRQQAGESVTVDETLLRITTLPEFKAMDQWRASVQSAQMVPPLQAQPTASMNRISPRMDPASLPEIRPAAPAAAEPPRQAGQAAPSAAPTGAPGV